MCYTSGTTGNPKGVAYSPPLDLSPLARQHHHVGAGASQLDRGLVVVPQFHANAWGMPYSSWVAGADLIMPRQFLQAEPLVKIIEAERPTFGGRRADDLERGASLCRGERLDLSSISRIVCGGSAVPLSLMRRFEERFGYRSSRRGG